MENPTKYSYTLGSGNIAKEGDRKMVRAKGFLSSYEYLDLNP